MNSFPKDKFIYDLGYIKKLTFILNILIFYYNLFHNIIPHLKVILFSIYIESNLLSQLRKEKGNLG